MVLHRVPGRRGSGGDAPIEYEYGEGPDDDGLDEAREFNLFDANRVLAERFAVPDD